MRDPALEKTLLAIMSRRPGSVTRTALGAEAEVILDRPLTTLEFAEAIAQLTRSGLIEETRNAFDMIVYTATKRGLAALRG